MGTKFRMDKENETLQSLLINTTEYAENATVHGIKYIFEKVKASSSKGIVTWLLRYPSLTDTSGA